MNDHVRNNFYLEFPAEPGQIAGARNQVADFTRQQDWDEMDVDALTLAVGEACNNAVNYGGKGSARPFVAVSCRSLSPAQMQVEIKNQGNGFHPNLSKLSQMPDADDFATCGRGFALMQALVDDVQVQSDGRNTIVRLTKTKSDPTP